MNFIGLDALCSLIKSYSAKDVLITFHSIGDRDAVGSAVALSRLIPNSVVATPDFLTNNAKRMLESVGYAGRIDSKFENKDAVIVLDANNIGVLGKFSMFLDDFNGELLFIDHHMRQLKAEGAENNATFFNDESYNSTASIIYEVAKRNSANLDKVSAILLLNGISADSADFQNADARTFMQISELLSLSKIGFSSISEYYHASIPVQNRLMTIDDIRSSHMESRGNYIIAYGRATAHANIVADAAMNIGADVAVFWAITEREASISARLRSPLDKTLGINLGELMEEVADLVGGQGGGHACAAGAYGPNKENAEIAGREIVDKIKEKVK